MTSKRPPSRGKPRKGEDPLLGFSILTELRDVGPEIVDLFLVLDTGEGHLGAGNLRPRILDVFLELGLIPGDARILVGIGVIVIRHSTGLAAVEPVELWPDLV